jgi:hypothetical protein
VNDHAPIPTQPLAAERSRLQWLLANTKAKDKPEIYVLCKQRISSLRQQLSDMAEEVEAFGLDHIRECGPFEVGDTRHYEKTDKQEKDRDPTTTFHALLAAADGDLAVATACLASDAIKAGAAKKVLGPDFAKHFETRIKYVVATGRPRKVIGTTSLTWSKQ